MLGADLEKEEEKMNVVILDNSYTYMKKKKDIFKDIISSMDVYTL